MKSFNYVVGSVRPRLVAGLSMLVLAALLGGCASDLPVAAAPASLQGVPNPGDDGGQASALAYYQNLQRMSAAQLGRERAMLAAVPQSPGIQVRMAMLLGNPRGQPDLAKALNLLDAVLKSSDPVAVGLQPLARLLADSFGERQKLEIQLDKQGQQLKESQRKAGELQEKIDSLADIERTLPQRPRATRQGGATR
jgi:hypothetical protein